MGKSFKSLDGRTGAGFTLEALGSWGFFVFCGTHSVASGGDVDPRAGKASLVLGRTWTLVADGVETVVAIDTFAWLLTWIEKFGRADCVLSCELLQRKSYYKR